MKRRLRHMLPGLFVAIALGASGTLLVTSAGGGTRDAKRPHENTPAPAHEPLQAECTFEDNGFAIGAEIARRQIELWTTGSTTVFTPPICYP